MKKSQVVAILASEYGSQNINELNLALKKRAAEKIKYKLMAEVFGHLGLTVAIKMVTDEGLKVFDTKRVRLVRFSDLQTFEKAKPKVARPVYDKPKKKKETAPKKERFSRPTFKKDQDEETPKSSTSARPAKTSKPFFTGKPQRHRS